MSILIRQVRSEEEYLELGSLRYRILVEQDGRFPPSLFPDCMILDESSQTKSKVHFIAYIGSHPAGFVTLTGLGDRYQGVPAVDMIGTLKTGGPLLSILLLHEAIRYFKTLGFESCRAHLDESYKVLLESMGFKESGDSFHSFQLGVSVLPMRLKLSDCRIDTGIDPSRYHHAGRLILEDGEILFDRGDAGGVVYLVVKGLLEMRHLEDGSGEVYTDLLEPGRIVGASEMSVNQIRTSQAVAKRHCEVLMMSSERLLEYLDQRYDFDEAPSQEAELQPLEVCEPCELPLTHPFIKSV